MYRCIYAKSSPISIQWDHLMLCSGRKGFGYHCKVTAPITVKNNASQGGLIMNVRLSMEWILTLCCVYSSNGKANRSKEKNKKKKNMDKHSSFKRARKTDVVTERLCSKIPSSSRASQIFYFPHGENSLIVEIQEIHPLNSLLFISLILHFFFFYIQPFLREKKKQKKRKRLAHSSPSN